MIYKKFKSDEECAFPDRLICNYCDCGKLKRCEYMKYNRSKSISDPTRWECIYKNPTKDKQKQNINKGETI